MQRSIPLLDFLACCSLMLFLMLCMVSLAERRNTEECKAAMISEFCFKSVKRAILFHSCSTCPGKVSASARSRVVNRLEHECSAADSDITEC